MKIHCLTTGTVSVKRSFLFPATGPRRQLGLFLPSAWSAPLPIHCWAIEHDGVLRLVDTGETAAARDVPFARMHVTAEQELPAAMAAAGLALEDVAEVVLTHAHGDHMDGLVHVRGPVLINEDELRFLASPMARVMRRVLHQPLPAGFAPEPFALDGGPFGAFARTRALSDDGRIVAVATPGHTPGHICVICVDDSGQHVMLAGDATDSLEQLRARRCDAIGPDPKAHVATLDTILAHCAEHPTVYLPSHDPETLARFTAATTVNLDGPISPSGTPSSWRNSGPMRGTATNSDAVANRSLLETRADRRDRHLDRSAP
jgi:N-acyl homoserine lactone hydrolase